MQELKPCPFCGSKDLKVLGRKSRHPKGYYVACGGITCWVNGALRMTKDQAVEAWNSRVECALPPST